MLCLKEEEQQQLQAAMAQLDRIKSLVKNTKDVDNEQSHGVDGRWGSPTTPMLGRQHDQEEDREPQHDQEEDREPQTKKSVLAKVKEKAKKWKNTLGKKKNGNEGAATPEWGVSLDDDNEDEPEYLGAPIYESQMANEGSKDTAGTPQHSRMAPVMSEKHVTVTGVSSPSRHEKDSPSTPVSVTHLFKPKLKESPTSSMAILKQRQKESHSRPVAEPMSSADLKQKQKESPISSMTEAHLPSSTSSPKQKHKESPRKPIMDAVANTTSLLKPKHKESPSKPATDPVSSINFFKQKSKEKSTSNAATDFSSGIHLVKQQDKESPSKRIAEPLSSINPIEQQDKEMTSKRTTKPLISTGLPEQQNEDSQYEDNFTEPSRTEPVANTVLPEQQQKEYSSEPLSADQSESNINILKQQEQIPINTMPSESRTNTNPPIEHKERPTGTTTEAETSINPTEKQHEETSIHTMTESGTQEKEIPNKTMTKSMSEKIAPAYTMVSDATKAITSKIQPVATSTSSSTSNSKEMSRSARKWDKGVSVKEYLMHKLEPGDEERALSRVISEAISPRKVAGDTGVVEKVRDAVSSMLSSPLSSSTMKKSTMNNPITNIPISTNAEEVVIEDENHGRILQTN